MKTTVFFTSLGAIGDLGLGFALFAFLFGLSLGLVTVLWALCSAPEGYEDEEGFHLVGTRPRVGHSVALLHPHNAG